MTVTSASASIVKPGRGADAIELMKKLGEGITRNGAKNVRVLLNTRVVPMQIALSWEAESNAEQGQVTDSVYADTAFLALWGEAAADNSPVGTGATQTWTEV